MSESREAREELDEGVRGSNEVKLSTRGELERKEPQMISNYCAMRKKIQP
jgi:hypothetical protein